MMEGDLVAVFQDTQRLLWGNEYLCQLTAQAVMCTRVFPENFDTTRVMGSFPTGIMVTEERTLQAARRMAAKYTKVAVLNFANAVNPGGGVVYGASEQEEDLCRCTNLYSCLVKPELYVDFYGYNNSMSQYYSDRVIYSPNITVFKTDDDIPVYTNEWFQVDILSCPAPNLNGITVPDYQKLEKIYNSRIRNILAIAEANGVQALVLGAFGCGAFSNPPELVAKAFYQQLQYGDYKNTFREVVFAIKAENPQGIHNLQVFRSILTPWQQNSLFGKKVSVLGDSISTFWGSSPEGLPVFYEGKRCIQAGIYSVNDTWWMKVLQNFGGSLLVNHSCMGGRVSGNSALAGYSDNRVCHLHEGQCMPDVILIALGAEDYEAGIPVEPNLGERVGSENFQNYFRTSYQMMLWKLRQMYPNAEIYCATLGSGIFGNGKSSFSTDGIYGISLKKYNQAIRECAAEYGCMVADLEKHQKWYDTLDGIHPTVQGMIQLAEGWIHSIENCQNIYPYLEEESKKQWGTPVLCGLASCLIIIVIFISITLL